MTIKICMFVGLKSTTQNPPHNVWCMHVCVESTGRSTFNDSAGALDKSIKAGLNTIKGIRKKRKFMIKFNQCSTMAWQIKVKTQNKVTFVIHILNLSL